MLQFLNLKPEIFGIDINDLSLKIVRLKKKRKGFSLVSFNEVDIKPGIVEEGVIKNEETLVKIIKSACKTVKGKKIGTKYVVASLPEEKSFSQVIQMPEMDKDELKSAVPFEAENYIPLPIDKVYLDFQAINLAKDGVNYCDGDHCDLLIAATPKSIVDSYVSCLKKSGLVPYALEVESQAIARALVNNPSLILADEPTGNLDSKAGQQIMAILDDLNNRGHTIVVVTHESEIARFAKRILKMKDGCIVGDEMSNNRRVGGDGIEIK